MLERLRMHASAAFRSSGGSKPRFVCAWRDPSRFRWSKTPHRARFSCCFSPRMTQNPTSCTTRQHTPRTFVPSTRTSLCILRQAPVHDHAFCATRPPESPPNRTCPALLRHFPAQLQCRRASLYARHLESQRAHGDKLAQRGGCMIRCLIVVFLRAVS